MPDTTPIDDPFPYNPAKARSLLAQAGVSNLTLTLDVQSGRAEQQDIATVLQSSWKQIGVTLNVKVLGASAFIDDVYNWKDQMYMIQDGSPIDDAGYFLGYFVRCGDPFNWTQYCNQDVTNWLSQTRLSSDHATLKQLYKQIQLQVAQDCPYLMLMQIDDVVVTNRQVHGWIYYQDQVTRYAAISKG
jgi:peptide/nickel transport system substrate-binding protein